MFPRPALSQDRHESRYRNPVLFSDYSDPDVIRVGQTYYLVASSFHFVPGIPVLEAEDLVHWHIISHVIARLKMSPGYDLVGGNRYGQGVWAPAIRFHNGRFYVYFPTPEEGIFMSSAPSPRGPWTEPKAILPGAGYEDPCPFWDDDGKAYLIHSRVGAGPLILHRMSADGAELLDLGTQIVKDPQHLPTLEGPKLYKRDGFYYIFAPYGGVATGAQAVLRAKNLYGPWEWRTVLQQGATQVRGPHQGAWVETPAGQDWFMHFSQHGGYGRIVYLEPMRWDHDWPVIGEPIAGSSAGQPVVSWPMPDTGGADPADVPATSDEFNRARLGLQWEWNHNPDDSLWSLTDRPGFLRLRASLASDLIHAKNTLTQQMQFEAFHFTAAMDTSGMKDGQRAGLAMLGIHPSWIGVVQTQTGRQVVYTTAAGQTIVGPPSRRQIQLRMQVSDQQVSFSYSQDGGRTFHPIGSPNPFVFSWWKAARPALFSFNTARRPPDAGSVDFDWVHCREIAPIAHESADMPLKTKNMVPASDRQ